MFNQFSVSINQFHFILYKDDGCFYTLLFWQFGMLLAVMSALRVNYIHNDQTSDYAF